MLEDKLKLLGIKHVYIWTSGFINPKFYEKQGYKIFTILKIFMKLKVIIKLITEKIYINRDSLLL